MNTGGILKWVIPLAANLANVLTKSTQKCLEQLEVNVDNLRTKLHQKQHIYFLLLSSAGTKTAFACLDSLSEQLQSLVKEYEQQWQKFLYKSNANRYSFENLSTQISHWWEFSKQQKVDWALNSLRLTYKYPLDPVPADFLKQYLSPRINAIGLLEEIEKWIDCTRYEWVNLDSNELSRLRAEILMRIQPACWEFYSECFQVSKKLNSTDITNIQK